MNRRILIVSLFLFAAIFTVYLAHTWSGGNAEKSRVIRSAIPVTVASASSADVQDYVMGVGAAQALKTVVVRTRIDGELTEVDFTEGSEVREGQILAKLDARQVLAQIKQTEASIAKDQTAIDQAARDVARAADLFSRGAGPQLNLDNAKSALEASKAALAGDQALLDNQKVQLSWYTLVAPLGGRSGVLRVDPGNIVHAADAAGLVTITQMKPAALVFSLSQDSLDKVKAAMAQGPLEVIAYNRDGSAELGVGKLQLIDNPIDPSSGTISLKAILPNEDERLWPGEFVSVKLLLGVRKQATTVPATAAQRAQSGYYVFVIKPDSTVERRPVEIAEIRDDIAIVTKGLATGEPVVVDGQYKLLPGQKVSFVDPDKSKAPKVAKETPVAAASDAQPPKALKQ